MPFPDPELAVDPSEIPARPGLGDKDRKILDAMIANGFVVADQMWFNQAVGNLDPTIQGLVPEHLREWYERTYSKRPDVIFIERGIMYAAELKPYASYVALGQALMYKHWANEKADPPRTIIPLILTDIADPDLLPVAAMHAVEVRQLGAFIEDRPSFQT